MCLIFTALLSSCVKTPEMTLEEIEAAKVSLSNDIISRTLTRPRTDNNFVPGKVGGVWNASISGDPKSFNLLIAEQDAETNGVLAPLSSYLADYDLNSRDWVPFAASFEIRENDDGSQDIKYTLRSDLYWSYYNNAKPRVPVTSDDVIWWYDEIQGDEDCASSAYNAQYMENSSGESERITITKIDDKSFYFHFPRAVAEPLLSTNMTLAPSFLYKKAKEEGGAEGVKKFLNVSSDPKLIPSCGPYFLVEYTPGQRLLYERNPDYWEKDSNGESHYYPQTRLVQIVGDPNTANLLFNEGKLEAYSPSPDKVDSLLASADNGRKKGNSGYSVFNAEGSMSASFWSFNQNPKNKDEAFYSWFTKKEFRQAMSCLLNRERIIRQTYRGLAEPTYYFFPKINKYYNENLILKYRYSHEKARKLLESIGFTRRDDGFLYDTNGSPVVFDLTVVSNNPVVSDIAQIIVDECKKEGITVNVRQTDFQRLVEQLMSTFDWQTMIIGLNGGSLFPTQGSNVWVSSGNLHLWNPLQKSPATEWEARVDELYHEAACISDKEKAAPLWNEYQEIFLEQCPVVYLVRSRSFFAIRNKWDLTNVRYDNLYGATTEYCFLAE